ncbi:MAG: hypothetical protein M3R30_01275 [Candidatus Eremiobacteraeota bacterium]|nr:hypothetical protein [Candidatus Eremiobacteraeota bacterium]
MIKFIAFVGACALLTAPVLAADSVDAIIANPSAFDGKSVQVHGTVADVRQKTSRKGNDYTLFDVCETKCVHIYAHGKVGVTNGAVVTVTGTFTALKHMGDFDITNQIQANDGEGTSTPAPAASAAPPVR